MTSDDHIDARLHKLFAVCARIVGIAVALVGAITVTARVLGEADLQFGTGGVGMSFLLAGTALLLLSDERQQRFRSLAGYILAASVSLLAFINLGRYFFGLELANTLANVSLGDFEVARLITMSPSDSIEMFLIGISLLMIQMQLFKIRPSELLTFSATIISIMTLLGVILHIDTFCLFVACARITTVGGLTFAALCLGTLFARPTQGLMRIMVSQYAGGIMARRLIPAALFVPVLFSWGRMQMQQAGVNEEVSLTTMIMAMVIFFSLLLWWNAWSIERIDAARQRANALLRESERRTRMIIQQAIDAFVALDVEGIVKDWNERAECTFGWRRDEILGQSVFTTGVPERFRANAQLGLEQLLTRSEATIPGKPLETIAQHKDGHEFPVEISLFPVKIDDDLMLCGFVRDISERKEVEQRFKEFYSTVSHELRSPLTSIRGSINVIKAIMAKSMSDGASLGIPDKSLEQLIHLLDIADDSLERLIRLINDLLDVKRIEEGYFDLELQPLDPIKVVTLAVDGLQGMAAKQRVELEIVIDDTSIFSADADRIVQVLFNLITNGIKFSPEGDVVTVRVLKSRNPQRIRFNVEDHGPGIPPAELHKLFSKFGQLAEGRKKLGTGLGLAISKAIVEMHSGEIGIDSSIGKGTTFWFELPLSLAPRAVKDDQMATINLNKINIEPKEEALKEKA